MTYVSVARGYVAGGFPANSINNPLGKPEVPFEASASWTYETGFKSELFDRRLKLTGAVFFNDVKSGHLFVFDVPTASFTVATLDYQSWGGELEAAVRVAPGFELFGGIGLTQAELVNVPAGSATGARDGNRVPNVAPLTANLGIQYQVAAASLGLPGDVFVRGNYQFVGTRAADVANSFNLPSYGIVNGKLGWKGQDVEAYVFANNLFDERYQVFGQSFGPTTQSVRVGQGRIVGVGATARF
jgi:iron complex outermembrane recepter protein